MSREDLPSIDDYIVDPESLPSVEDYITEEVDAELPSVEDYIEIEEATQTIEDADGNTFAEVKDIIPPFPELIRLINDVRKDIPDIPEIKYYDKELESLTEQINQVREEIPEIPEVRYYEGEIEAICEQIDLVKQVIEKNAADIPEIKYYDDQISVLEQRLEQVNQNIDELPEPKYYEEDIQSLRIAVQEVQDQIPTFPKWVNEVNEVPDFSWIGKTFSVIDDDFVKVHDAVEGLRGKVEYDLDRIEEHFDKKEFETRTDFNELRENINTRFDTEKEKIWKEIKETSMRMWGHHKEFKDDDRKLKKQILGEYNTLKQTLREQIKEVNKESIKTDELILNYFNNLKEEVSQLPEVKYYEEDIERLQTNIDSVSSNVSQIVGELYKIATVIKNQQQVIKEEINNRPIAPDPSQKQGNDPLTPTNQEFATLKDLAANYRLFVNRVEQQLYTIGGGGAGFIKDLDDVSFDTGIGTNKLLIYNGSQWVGIASTALVGTDQDLTSVLTAGNVTGLGMSVGIITTTELHVGVDTGFFTEDLVVNGDARITGIITVGRSSITIDGPNDQLIIGNTVIGTTDANYSGIVTAGSIVADSATFAGNITVGGTITYDDVTNIDSIGIVTARNGIEIGANSATTVIKSEAITATTTTTSQSNIDTFSATTFRSAQYQIQITRGSLYHVTTVNLVHDGSTVYMTEFGTIKTSETSLASFDADINSGNVRLRGTPSSSDSTVFKILRTLIKV